MFLQWVLHLINHTMISHNIITTCSVLFWTVFVLPKNIPWPVGPELDLSDWTEIWEIWEDQLNTPKLGLHSKGLGLDLHYLGLGLHSKGSGLLPKGLGLDLHYLGQDVHSKSLGLDLGLHSKGLGLGLHSKGLGLHSLELGLHSKGLRLG